MYFHLRNGFYLFDCRIDKQFNNIVCKNGNNFRGITINNNYQKNFFDQECWLS